jgi:hypothetical protein
MKITKRQLRRIIKESIQSPRDEMMSYLQSKFDISFMKPAEEFSRENVMSAPSGIWLSAEDRDMMPNGKDLIFDYYSTDYDMYDVGVNIEFMDMLAQYGWYAEWNDAGTIMLWPVANIPSMMEADGTTEKYDNDSALKGKQSKLPDALQKSIIDKVVEDREETEEKEKKSKLVKEGTKMKITKRQLRRIIKEEKQKLVKEMRRSPGDAIAAAEKGLAAIMLQKVLEDPDGPTGTYEASEIFEYMYDLGFEDFDTQAALDQLADRYNLN